LRAYFSDALAGGPSDDGLFQRFQILVWPDTPRDWKLIDRPPNARALVAAERVFSVLVNLSVDSPVSMRFDGDSQTLFYSWLGELEHRIRGESMSPILVSHIAKYRRLMPALAGAVRVGRPDSGKGRVGHRSAHRLGARETSSRVL